MHPNKAYRPRWLQALFQMANILVVAGVVFLLYGFPKGPLLVSGAAFLILGVSLHLLLIVVAKKSDERSPRVANDS